MLLKYCYLSTAFYSFQHVHQLIRWMRTLWWSDTFKWYVKEWYQINPKYGLTGLLVLLMIIWVFHDLTQSFCFFFKTCFCCFACFGFVSYGSGWICCINELLWCRTNLLVTCTNVCMCRGVSIYCRCFRVCFLRLTVYSRVLTLLGIGPRWGMNIRYAWTLVK